MRRVFAAVAILSSGVLGYEILLTRLLSIVQWHHFAYMIISLALLGFGASGTFLTFMAARLSAHYRLAFVVNASLFAAGSVGCFMIVQSLPLNLLEIAWSAAQPLWLTLAYVLLMLPFFFAANCIALTFVCYPKALATTYACDLAGAALGCGALLWLLAVAEPAAILMPVAACGVLAAIIVACKPRWLRWGSALLVLGATPHLMRTAPIELEYAEYKGLPQAERVAGATVADSRSGPLGLLTTVQNPAVPFRHAPGLSITGNASIPEQIAVFTDAGSATMINRYTGEHGSIAYLDRLTSALPYHLTRIESVLVLAAGAGGDVLQALFHGSARITAVESNAQLIDLVRNEYAEFSGGIYRDPRIDVRIAQPRDFISRDRQQYDLVQMGGQDAFGAAAGSLHALNESYAYTVEALQSALERLGDGGFVAITRNVDLPPRDPLKIFATAVAALEARGVGDPSRQLAWVRSWSSATLIIKNGALTAAQVDALREFAAERRFDVAYYPGMARDEANRYNVLSTPLFFDAATAILGQERPRFLSRYKFRITPSTDDRPFHFHFFKWQHLPEMLALRARGGMGLLELGYVVLVTALVQALLVSIVLTALPLVWLGGGGARVSAWSRAAVVGYFLSVGLAFLSIEIAFIQIFVRFLGHPVYSVTVVLASFLLFAALGSKLVASRVRESRVRARNLLLGAVCVIGSLALAYVVVLPAFFETLAGAPFAARACVTVLLIAPLACAMGTPFPLGLDSLSRTASHLIPWAWAINGCASVVSAVLAVVLAMHLGFSAVILFAAILYGIVAAIGWSSMYSANSATV